MLGKLLRLLFRRPSPPSSLPKPLDQAIAERRKLLKKKDEALESFQTAYDELSKQRRLREEARQRRIDFFIEARGRHR